MPVSYLNQFTPIQSILCILSSTVVCGFFFLDVSVIRQMPEYNWLTSLYTSCYASSFSNWNVRSDTFSCWTSDFYKPFRFWNKIATLYAISRYVFSDKNITFKIIMLISQLLKNIREINMWYIISMVIIFNWYCLVKCLQGLKIWIWYL